MENEEKGQAADPLTEMMKLQNAVGAFMSAFATIESLYLTFALILLSHDQQLVEHLEELMDFSDRLKLMLRLTVERHPNLVKDAKVINSAGKKLCEHRNRIAHGAASVVSGSLQPGAPIKIGIRKQKSDRKVPAGFKGQGEELQKLMDKWYITADEVIWHYAEAMQLQAQMRAFHAELQKIRYSTT